jgi:hypothetical protein
LPSEAGILIPKTESAEQITQVNNEIANLQRAKFHNTGKHDALSHALGKDVWIMVGESSDVGYTEGLMSKVQLKNEGDSVRKLLMQMN